LLHQTAPNLRAVHFVAHSAGAWVAREAATNLLAKNPYVVVQVTLLDPFIPDANLGMATGLSNPAMSAVDEASSGDRIYRLEKTISLTTLHAPITLTLFVGTLCQEYQP
jgi:pimeloyl-ACP methyl ester carboxylesterase